MPEPLEPVVPPTIPSPEISTPKPSEERQRKSARDTRYSDEIPSGTFRIPRV